MPPRIEIMPPDIGDLADGNTGTPYVWSFTGASPGPHAVVTALIHGNEFSGAIALAGLLRRNPAPIAGRITLVFANVAAFSRFDPSQPNRSRFLDQDMNRLWHPDLLDGPDRSAELDRARELQPIIDTADFLLDLHSMQQPSPAMIMSGPAARGRALARKLGAPRTIVADGGHSGGPRLIDYTRFVEPHGTAAAILLEAGQHWAAGTPAVAADAVERFLVRLGLVEAPAAPATAPCDRLAEETMDVEIEVTETLTVAADRPFRFAERVASLDCIPAAGTVIAFDGDRPVVTPYDDCILIMPSQVLVAGHTAVRLGRRLSAPAAGDRSTVEGDVR